jgi:hypothetical protein
MYNNTTAIIIFAKTEWTVIKSLIPEMNIQPSPFGECGEMSHADRTDAVQVVFFYGGWGKIKIEMFMKSKSRNAIT